MAGFGIATTGAATRAADSTLPVLVRERVASRLAVQDPSLWGSDACDEAAIRLGWVNPYASSRPLIEPIMTLRDRLREQGIHRVVLAGTGGSSLAPEVIAAASGVDLTVLDSTDPGMVSTACQDLSSTVVVISSKSGSTAETDVAFRVFTHAFTAADLSLSDHMVVVTDPDSPLRERAAQLDITVFTADPMVGGRYSALTAFGLVPAGLAGVDIMTLLEEGLLTQAECELDDQDNPALVLASALAGNHPRYDKLLLADENSGLPGFGAWVEQLVAESTGKKGRGLIPAVVGPEDVDAQADFEDTLHVRVVEDLDCAAPGPANAVILAGGLGAQFMVWEYAVAIACRLLEVNPFDQPDVEFSKQAARELLKKQADDASYGWVSDGSVELAKVGNWGGDDPSTLEDGLKQLLSQVGPRGYAAILIFGDRYQHQQIATGLRSSLAQAAGRQATFGWGPRFLHSTGQVHKGGPAEGVFLHVLASTQEDVEIPGLAHTCGQQLAAQATGDAQVLAHRGRPVLLVRTSDPSGGIEQVHQAIRACIPSAS